MAERTDSWVEMRTGRSTLGRMTAIATRTESVPFRTGFYFGWVQVLVAAAAMVATLPGRTQGLGLITEPLLADLGIGAVAYATMNLWATLLGALFAPLAGHLLDRLGARTVLAGLGLALGLTVLAMSRIQTPAMLGVCLLFTRGLGQSALSAASIALVGHWFRRRLSSAMAVYSLLLSLGFMIAFPVVEQVVRKGGWRAAWAGIGWAVLALVPAALFLVRRSSDAVGLEDGEPEGMRPRMEPEGLSLLAALATPAFWIVGLSSALYLLVASGIGLFNERILVELGFERTIYIHTLVISAFSALAGNFLGGWLAGRGSIRRLLSTAMALLAAGLLALPHLRSLGAVYAQAVLMGVAGGFVTVIFFAFWSREYGRRHLGQIQGAAQALTVVGSALGPLALAQCHAVFGSHAPVFRVLAVAVAVMAVLAARMPAARPRIAGS
jgi:MFS family permease